MSIRTIDGSEGYALCDSCYRKLFPATAMFENTQNGSFVRNTVFKLSSNINRQIENLKPFEIEEEECRQCLDKGTFRRCCKKFYCRQCYFQLSKCPGCKTPCHRSGVGGNMALFNDRHPSRLAVLSTWCLSFSITFALISAVIFLTVNRTNPKQTTVWMHFCRTKCNTPICIDFPSIESDAIGALSDLFPYKYSFCEANKTVNQILGNACIFDHELFKRSKKKLGFDICIEPKVETDLQTSKMSKVPLFDHQVVIFEDTFDHWQDSSNFTSSILASSKWHRLMNARALDICGHSNQTLAYERRDDIQRPPKIYDSSLVFTGFNKRFAETQDLDLSFGGAIEFSLKMAPIVDNANNYSCKTLFGGQISLLYSIDNGVSWSALRNFPNWKYRSTFFHDVSIEIPENVWSSSVRFKWEQLAFDPQRDYWAIDDLRIYHRFRPSWQSSEKIAESSEQHHEEVRIEQCCYDSGQCPAFPNDEVCEDFKRFRFHSMHVYAFLAIISTSFRNMISDFRHKVYYPLEGSTKVVPIELDVSTTFHIYALCCTFVPQICAFAILCYHFADRWQFYSQNSIELAFLLVMMIMDFNTLRLICRRVLCVWPFQKSPLIYFISSDESVKLSIDEKLLSLSDVISVDCLSQRIHKLQTAATYLTTLPLFSFMIINKIMNNPYGISEIITHYLGICVLLRSLLGALWLVHLLFIFTWIFTVSVKNRHIMGRALQRPFANQMAGKIAIFFIIGANMQLIVRFGGEVSLDQIILNTIFALIGGIIVGSTVAMLHFLPVNCCPTTFKVTSWPSQTLSFVTLTADDGMMRLHVLHLKDIPFMRSVLNGSTEISSFRKESESVSENSDILIENDE